jgi:hypothetical protein
MPAAQLQYASPASLADAAYKLAPPPAAALAEAGGPAAAQTSSFAKSIRTLSSRIQPTNYNMVRGGCKQQRQGGQRMLQ